jgi:hypothetical protein
MFSRDSGHNPILILGLFGLVAVMYLASEGALNKAESDSDDSGAIAQVEPGAQEFPSIAELIPEVSAPAEAAGEPIVSAEPAPTTAPSEPVTQAEPETKMMIGNQLRESPDISGDFVGEPIPQGADIQTTGNTNGQWSEVIYNGITGWIAFE